MSINFTAKVMVCVSYLEQDDTTWTRPFEQVTSSLDLGNHRALRAVLPLNSNGCIEDCGSMLLDGIRALTWLDNAKGQCGPQVQWAMDYLSSAMAHITECNRSEREQYGEAITAKQTITVEVSWG